MHIGKKIIDEIRQTLDEEYFIPLTNDEYETFTNPFYDGYETFHREDYKSRQCTSVGLMNKIMVHDGKKILRFLSELAGMEPQIQELQPWNRDHVVHAIHTFFTGVYILKKIGAGEKYKDHCNLKSMWRLIAPTHDIGYPFEIAGNIQKGFIDLLNRILSKANTDSPDLRMRLWPDNLDELCDGGHAKDLIQHKLHQWGLEIDVEDYYSWLQKLNRVDHGVIGALAHLKIMDAVHQKKNGIEPDMVSAATSIFIHNIDPQYPYFNKKINFLIAPEAFLLFLCDTFQEWDRYADRRAVFHGHEFDIDYRENSIYLYAPPQLEKHMCETVGKRLEGLPILVNNRLAAP